MLLSFKTTLVILLPIKPSSEEKFLKSEPLNLLTPFAVENQI
jgi:hypothetical protein